MAIDGILGQQSLSRVGGSGLRTAGLSRKTTPGRSRAREQSTPTDPLPFFQYSLETMPAPYEIETGFPELKNDLLLRAAKGAFDPRSDARPTTRASDGRGARSLL